MIRTLIAVTAFYAYGHPEFDAFRPAVLDRPVQGFYTEVNLAARDGTRVLATFDSARVMRYLRIYIQSMDAQLRPAK
jgi:hypothetical protein